MKTKWYKRVLLLGLTLLLSIGLLSACGKPEGSPLPEGMDEEVVLNAGREIVALLNAGEYQAVVDRLRDDVAAGGARPLKAEDMEKVMEAVSKAQAYVEETDAMATGQSNKDFDEDFAEAVIFAKHEKKNVRYRIAFDTDMNLIGIQVKVI